MLWLAIERSTSFICFSPYNLWLGRMINLLFLFTEVFFFMDLIVIFFYYKIWLLSCLRVYFTLKTQVFYFKQCYCYTYINVILMRKRTLLILNLVCLWLCWTGFSMNIDYFWKKNIFGAELNKNIKMKEIDVIDRKRERNTLF